MKVWVFVVDHRHGTNVSVHPSKEAADAANQSYCDEWFENEFGSETKPPLGHELASRYWDLQSDRGEEWHMIEECEVTDLQFPPILITQNHYGVKPGFYTRPDIVRLLHLHAASMLAVRFIAKAIGGEQ